MFAAWRSQHHYVSMDATRPRSYLCAWSQSLCSSLKGLEIAGIKVGHAGIKAVKEEAVRPCGLLWLWWYLTTNYVKCHLLVKVCSGFCYCIPSTPLLILSLVETTYRLQKGGWSHGCEIECNSCYNYVYARVNGVWKFLGIPHGIPYCPPAIHDYTLFRAYVPTGSAALHVSSSAAVRLSQWWMYGGAASAAPVLRSLFVSCRRRSCVGCVCMSWICMVFMYECICSIVFYVRWHWLRLVSLKIKYCCMFTMYVLCYSFLRLGFWFVSISAKGWY
jgi:hypothetical protein